MREIKFRAIDPMDKCWVYSSDNGLHNFFYGIEDGQLDGETLGEYAGLKDKNGEEIWESNLIIHHSRNGARPHLVVFDLDQAAWCGDYGLKYPLMKNELREIEVIGNIHENPKVLETGGKNGHHT